jgi:hypothetical protein
LENAARTNLEARFHRDFSGVRLHDDGEGARSAGLLNAAAFTVGNHIVMGAGRYQPQTREGLHLLAHELAHTIQQRPGAHTAAPLDVAPANSPAERQASTAADRAVAGQPVPLIGSSLRPAIQRLPNDASSPAASDDQQVLGEKLVRDFPDGVSVAFYADSLDEAQRRATDWAGVHEAVAPRKSAIAVAKDIVFGKAISDKLTLAATLKAISAVLTAAVAKVTPVGGTAPDKPTKIKNLAIFAHGTTDWCGLSASLTSSTAATSVKSIAPVVTPDLNVLLFTCNSARSPSEDESWTKGTLEGGGTGSLGSEIRNAMVTEKIDKGTVWGHTTTGHISRNFAMRKFSAADGKNATGTAFAGNQVWPAATRLGYALELQLSAVAQGFTIDDSVKARFWKEATQAVDALVYRCYAAANGELKLNGMNLAEMTPTHPAEVATMLVDYWNKNYWTAEKIEALAAKVAKSAKLKQTAPAAIGTGTKKD